MRSVLWVAVLLWACDDPAPARLGDVAPEVDAVADMAPADAAVADDGAGLDAAADAEPDAIPPDAALVDADLQCPHDVPDTAAVVRPGESVDGAVCRDGSAWFALEVPPAHELSVVLVFEHDEHDLELRLFSANDLSVEVDASAGATDRERVGRLGGPDAWPALIEVYGYRGVPGTFTLVAHLVAAADQIDVETGGQISYPDKVFGPEAGFTGARPTLPARRVVVQARRAFDGAVVAETLTDTDGAYTLAYQARPDDAHTVEALAETRVAQLSARAQDRGRLVYAMASEALLPGDTPARVDLHATEGKAMAGAMNIVDVLGDALAVVTTYTDAEAPTLNVNWTPGRPYPCGSCYANDNISLGGGLEDTDEFDDDIVLHEFGHWFVDHFSHDDSPGGSHRDRQVRPTLAYGEGVAYFFAAMVRDTPHIVDTFIDAHRHIDLETVTQNGAERADLQGTTDDTEVGDLREEVVAGIMWDAYDAASVAEPFDTLSIGVDGHMALLVDVFGARQRPADVGAQGMDLADWLEALACQTGDAAPVQPLVDDRAFPWAVTGCAEKGRVRPPFALEARAGQVWLVPKGPLPPLTVRTLGPSPETRTVRCAKACAVASADAEAAVVVSAPGAPWAGASWIGTTYAARLLGGQPGDGLRRYRVKSR